MTAIRAGVKEVILPKLNEKDLKELAETGTRRQFRLVKTMDEVLQIAMNPPPVVAPRSPRAVWEPPRTSLRPAGDEQVPLARRLRDCTASRPPRRGPTRLQESPPMKRILHPGRPAPPVPEAMAQPLIHHRTDDTTCSSGDAPSGRHLGQAAGAHALLLRQRRDGSRGGEPVSPGTR